MHGVIRKTSNNNQTRIQHLNAYQCREGQLKLHFGDLTESSHLTRIVSQVQPTEIYNLGAQTQIGASFENAEYTANANALGVLRLIEAVRYAGLEKTVRFCQASSCDIFGQRTDSQPTLLTETSPFNPSSPYGNTVSP